VIGVIVTALFLPLLLTLNERISSITVRWAGVAGAITYPLFLIHGRVGLLTIQNVANDSNKYFVYGATMAILIAVAYLLLKLEKKVLNLRPFRALSGRA
jgi:peptidoglycan/LPS O-acetylase OafA/YrhL